MTNYDEQIKYLTEHPEKIQKQWGEGKGLFKFAGIEEGQMLPAGAACLTMIRKMGAPFSPYRIYINDIPNIELMEEVAMDERIPKYSIDIKVENLPVFKEWQERIDALQTK